VGFFVWQVYFAHVPHLYPPEFKHGEWLLTADQGPQGYFRKELYITGSIKQAWLLVAATDSFIVYLNGKAVDGKGYASLNVSGIYDVGHYLQPGKNILGVVARRLSHPGPAMVIVEGAYLDQTGHDHLFATDVSWKSSPVEQRQGGGEIPWYAEAFDTTAWMDARTAGRPAPSDIYPLNVHPLAFTLPPQGEWIGQPNSPQDRPTFSYSFTLPMKAEEAWIRIATAQSYSLIVNGVTVQGEKLDDPLTIRPNDASSWKADQEVSTDILDIASLLRAGLNSVAVSFGQSPFLPGTFVDGFVFSGGELLPFGTNSNWIETSPPYMANAKVLEHRTITTLASQAMSGGVLPVKRAMRRVLPLSYMAKRVGQSMVVVSLAVGSILMLWTGTSRALNALQGGSPEEASRLDALAHLPTLLGLSTLYVLSFDVRFDPAFPFRSHIVWLSVAALLVLKAVFILEAWCRKKWPGQISKSLHMNTRATVQYSYPILLLCLIVIGASLRLRDLDAQSLYHDEVHMVAFAQGLLERGYPYKMIGPIERPLATYELLPYPIALSATLLGFNDFALRLPAAFFGIMTIPLIYVGGKQVFDRRVGLLAATIYTFCPQALIWAKYLWNPQQTQFFALLTSILFYRAIRHSPMSPPYLYLAGFSFILTYLSWEGAGFFLPALCLGLVAVKGRDLTWLRDKHLWIAVGIVCLAVVMQLVRRLLLQYPYLVVGTGLSDVSLPTLYFLDPMYDPTFYITNFLLLENNILLSALLLMGIPFLFSRRGLLYYYILLFSVLFMLTNLLPNATIRYAYYLQTFLTLSTSAVALAILDCLVRSIRTGPVQTFHIVKSIMTISVFGILVLGSSAFMKVYRLTGFPRQTGIYSREDTYYIDYRGAAEFIKQHYREGDLVIAVMPETLRHYARIDSQYFAEIYASRQTFYDPSEFSPRFLEKTTGLPTVRTIDEFREVLNPNRRIWIMAVPDKMFSFLAGHDVVEYIRQHGNILYESYNAMVYMVKI
jgi:hypothetical protein